MNRTTAADRIALVVFLIVFGGMGAIIFTSWFAPPAHATGGNYGCDYSFPEDCEPEPTDEPTPTDDPDPTDEPTPTDEPDPTDEPTPTDEPDPTDEPTPTDEPDPTEEPTPTVVPEPEEPKPSTVPRDPQGEHQPKDKPKKNRDRNKIGTPAHQAPPAPVCDGECLPATGVEDHYDTLALAGVGLILTGFLIITRARRSTRRTLS